MKIKKLLENKLIEAEDVELQNSAEVAKDLNAPKDGQPLDMDDASTKEIVADMAAGAAEAGKPIDVGGATAQAKMVQDLAKIVVNPYGTGRLSEVESVLQRCLQAAIRNKRNGIDRDYPNVFIYGLAGFGKTAAVTTWVKEHAGLNAFECDVKNMDSATIGGIPYPVKDEKTGEMKQAPIGSSYWDGLFLPNTILILDEINRARQNVRGSLLGLVNNHDLPWSQEDKATGKVTTKHHFSNILFSIMMINPASRIFGVEEMDPAEISRNAQFVNQKADKRDFLRIIEKIYNEILANPVLLPEDKLVYQGQYDIAEALLKSTFFEFDSLADVERIWKKQHSSEYENYLNYRTFTEILQLCDGTKADYLDAVKHSGLSKEAQDKIKNGLMNYQDKVSQSNNPFAKASTPVNPQRAQTASADVENILAGFKGSLV